jgi:succinate dehydrogenase / fumarate reductase membrane anchor subunit
MQLKADRATSNRAPHVDIMRSPLGRARGLGSARSGREHWWAERVTAVALVPLTIWFIFAVLHLLGSPQPAVAHWAAHPVNTVLLLCLVAATFHHMALGLQVVIEDYIHDEAARMAALLAMKAVCVLLALAAIVSVLKLAF